MDFSCWRDHRKERISLKCVILNNVGTLWVNGHCNVEVGSWDVLQLLFLLRALNRQRREQRLSWSSLCSSVPTVLPRAPERLELVLPFTWAAFTRKCPHLDVMAVSDLSLTLHGLSWLNSHEGRDRQFWNYVNALLPLLLIICLTKKAKQKTTPNFWPVVMFLVSVYQWHLVSA